MNGNPFNTIEVEILKNKNLTHTEVSKVTGRSVSTICLKRKALGVVIKKDGRVTLPESTRELLMDMSKTAKQVAKLSNLTASQVSSKRYNMGLI